MSSEWQTVSNNKRVHKTSYQTPSRLRDDLHLCPLSNTSLSSDLGHTNNELESQSSIFNKSNSKTGFFEGHSSKGKSNLLGLQSSAREHSSKGTTNFFEGKSSLLGLQPSVSGSPSRNTSDLATSITKSIIKYTKDQIYLYKQINKDQQVSYELSNIFDKINDMFKTSTQYLESKKKINYNQFNHNRWELKKEEDNGVINIVCSGLNKITKSNIDEILKEIELQEIVLYNDLDKLTEKMIQKCINEVDFVKLYIQVIKHIILKCKWIVDDNNGIPVTFRRLFMNQLEMRFNNLINDVKNMKYDENESELIVIHSKTRKGLINLLTELYNNKIIGNQLIRYIFKNLENAYDEHKNDQYLEYWLILFKSVIENWLVHEKIYLNEQLQYIMSKMDKIISNKIKFMIQDQLDILKSKNFDFTNLEKVEKEDEEKVEVEVEVEKEDEGSEKEADENDENAVPVYDLLILSSTEYDTLDKWFEIIDSSILPEKLLLDLLQITLSEKKYFDTVKNVLEYLLKRQYITRDQVIQKIEYIKEENDLSEYKYYEKHLVELALI